MGIPSRATESVATTELKVGDVVHFYGGRFELIAYTCDADRAAYLYENTMHPRDQEGSLSLRAFRGKLISSRETCGIPESYFFGSRPGIEEDDGERYWTFQGNHRAMWQREVRS